MVVGSTDVEMKDASSPVKAEKMNGVTEEEPPKDPELLTLEGKLIFLLYLSNLPCQIFHSRK